VGRQITSLAPLLDAHLISGDRVNATLYPISRRGNTITIRRFSRDPWTVVKFIKNRTVAPELAAMLWQAIHYELNVLVVGGTASGKTSLLNTISNFIPTSQRIITIEDTRELVLSASHWNWVPMVSRLPNPEGLGEVTMLDLMINSLRMRPDRILVGEIREKTQAQVLFEAMHTGHSVYSTMHADTASEALRRLTEAPIEVPVIELESIDLIVSQFRDRKKNIRRTFEVSEIAEFVEKPSVNHIYLWRARNDSFERVNEPKRYIESLNLHTGMTAREIAADASEKTKVLEWMAKFGVEDVNGIGRVIKTYYKEPSSLLAAVEKGQPPAKVI
jgi:flagellar protein FlaI